MSKPLALVVDDEPDICELLGMTLERMGVASRMAGDISDARRLLERHSFAICLTDMRLPDGNGLDLVSWIQERQPGLPVAVITAHGNVEAAVDALKRGAFDFVSKPVQLEKLRSLVSFALKLPPNGERNDESAADRLLGNSPAIREVRTLLHRVSRSQAPVHLSGESGTGKELAARLIHASGSRASGPFVPVNCGAIPAELMESEFFGHKKGSFTGAANDKAGLFQTANGGTLFLDE
ncbi:MAG: sigma 54-interacting transcriptional regulator, partial [Gammaproteobacteria bacterium]